MTQERTQLTRSLIQLMHSLSIFSESKDPNSLLKKLIKLINEIIPVDSCLIYLYDKKEEKLTLIGSKKTKTGLIGNITLKKGEGITGWVAGHKKKVVLHKEAFNDKRFKLFTQLPEDKFEAFLSIPIKYGEELIGVINLQNKVKYKFSDEEIKIVESIIKIISEHFAKVMLKERIEYLENKLEERKLVDKAKGIIMKKLKISEDLAYKTMRKESMAKRQTMKKLAEAIIIAEGIGSF